MGSSLTWSKTDYQDISNDVFSQSNDSLIKATLIKFMGTHFPNNVFKIALLPVKCINSVFRIKPIGISKIKQHFLFIALHPVFKP